MALTVEIVSHETIKPSSPTPPSLRNYKFCHMDQLFLYECIPYLLFYSNTTAVNHDAGQDHRIKKALAQTLTHMYPLAGRVNHDHTSIDCNDHGAEYIVTRINERMSTVLESPKTHLLEQLVPLNLLPTWLSSSPAGSEPHVALQINHFSCGGVAIGACFRHNVADASSASAFLQMWAAISAGDQKYVPDKVGDQNSLIFPGRTTLFPALDDLEVFDSIWKEVDSSELHVNKLLVFDGAKVAALKQKVGLMQNTTRVQSVTAFLWAAIISAARDRNQELEKHLLYTPVNLRKRMEPPLPTNSLGNILDITTAMWKAAGDDQLAEVETSELVQELKRSIDMVTEEFVRKEHEDPDLYFTNLFAGMANSSKLESYVITSWCRFPFYETDFGWGKPVWAATLEPVKNVAILLDTSDGAGIEAWINMRKQDMEKLEKDPNFLAYVSAIHTL